MNLWETWKRGFYAWENATAQLLEQTLRSPLVLGPSGAVMTAMMKAKTASDRASAEWWGGLGLPTRRDQERTLHLLNQLQSRIIDLEEQLSDLSRR